MSLTAIVLGLINVIIVVLVLLLIGAIAMWIMGWLGVGIPANIQKLYMAIVAVVALYMIAALLLGIPTVKVIGMLGHRSV